MGVLFVLSVLGLFGSAGAALCNPTDSCPKLSDGLYCPVNDVTEHGDINRDVKLIAAFMGESPKNYAAALDVYQNGNFSVKGSGMRTLQALAKKDMTVNGKYTNTWYSGILDLAGSIDGIWHNYMDKCLQNTGFCQGKSDDFRKYIINKCAIGIVGGYATYEMGAAIWKAADGSLTDAGAPYAWDEAAAFYIGNVAPVIGDGYSGSAPGNLYSPYEFMWKRDKDYPTGTNIHTVAVPILNYGLLNIRTYNAANLNTAQTAMYKLMAIAAIRSAIKYSWKGYGGGTYVEKYHAEGWAYWRFGSGWIASVSATTKTAVQAVDGLLDLGLTSIPATTPCTIKATLEGIYDDIGITCAMVGAWKDAEAGSCLETACTDPASNTATLLSGSTEYLDMCKPPPSGASGAPHSAVANAACTAAAVSAGYALAF